MGNMIEMCKILFLILFLIINCVSCKNISTINELPEIPSNIIIHETDKIEEDSTLCQDIESSTPEVVEWNEYAINSKYSLYINNDYTEIKIHNKEKDNEIIYNNFDPLSENYFSFTEGEINACLNEEETNLAIIHTIHTSPDLQACTIIDLTDDKYPVLTTKMPPDIEEFVTGIDVTGKIQNAIMADVASEKYAIRCEIKSLEDTNICLRYFLTVNDVEIDGAYYHTRENIKEERKFDVSRAVTGVDTIDFIKQHEKVTQARDWFDGSTGSGDTTIYINGVPYTSLESSTITEKGISDLDSLRKYLSGLFTEDMTQQLMAMCKSDNEKNLDKVVILYYNNQLYIKPIGRGTDPYKVCPEYFIKNKNDNELTLVCRVYQLELDMDSGELIPNPVPIDYEYSYVRVDDMWLCDDYPIIW